LKKDKEEHHIPFSRADPDCIPNGQMNKNKNSVVGQFEKQ